MGFRSNSSRSNRMLALTSSISFGRHSSTSETLVNLGTTLLMSALFPVYVSRQFAPAAHAGAGIAAPGDDALQFTACGLGLELFGSSTLVGSPNVPCVMGSLHGAG